MSKHRFFEFSYEFPRGEFESPYVAGYTRDKGGKIKEEIYMQPEKDAPPKKLEKKEISIHFRARTRDEIMAKDRVGGVYRRIMEKHGVALAKGCWIVKKTIPSVHGYIMTKNPIFFKKFSGCNSNFKIKPIDAYPTEIDPKYNRQDFSTSIQ